MKTKSTRALIKITLKKKDTVTVNYVRRMYAVLRKYTPEVVESDHNVCFAELTGLRTFFKMSYEEMMLAIQRDLTITLGQDFEVKKSSGKIFDATKVKTKNAKQKSVTTYKEMKHLLSGATFIPKEERLKATIKKRVKLSVPFLGKVS